MSRLKLAALLVPLLPALSGHIRRAVAAAASADVAPRAWLSAFEELLREFLTLACSEPPRLRKLVLLVFTEETQKALFSASREELFNGDEAAVHLLSVMEKLKAVHPALPFHLFRFYNDPAFRELSLQIELQLERARSATGEERITLLRRLGGDGFFEPVYRAYLRALFVAMKAIEGERSGLPSELGALTHQLATGFGLPSAVVDPDAAFFRNSLQHGHFTYDDSFEFVTLKNRTTKANKPTEVRVLRTEDLLSRLERMHRTVTTSLPRALGIMWWTDLKDVFELFFDTARKAARAADPEPIVIDALNRALPLLDIARLSTPLPPDLAILVAEIPKSIHDRNWFGDEPLPAVLRDRVR